MSRLILSICLLSSLILSLPSYAKPSSEQFIGKEINDKAPSVDEYWTPERMRNAKPMPMPAANERLLPGSSNTSFSNNDLNEEMGSDGQPPSVNIKPNLQKLYTPIRSQLSNTLNKGKINQFDRGTLNQQFSSSQLVPITIDTVYPYRAVGKLFFTIPDQGDFVCSASALRARVILTAGHCVHRGSNGTDGFYSNFKFVPAFRDGAAPYQTWNWRYVATTNTWATGGGVVPNAADYAMIEPEDRAFNGTLYKIGQIVGYFGYQTSKLTPNHAHMLGYPCNFDNCGKMHVVTAQSARSVSPNNVEYGSDMRGGSSGGPWVQNFGVASVGQTGGLNAGRNRIIGVTSYGYVSEDPKAQGASIPDSRFIDLLNFICAHRAGNC